MQEITYYNSCNLKYLLQNKQKTYYVQNVHLLQTAWKEDGMNE